MSRENFWKGQDDLDVKSELLGTKLNSKKTKFIELKEKLAKYGYAGVTAYGINNLAYYSIATFLSWKTSFAVGRNLIFADKSIPRHKI